jgi:hypothetical protein
VLVRHNRGDLTHDPEKRAHDPEKRAHDPEKRALGRIRGWKPAFGYDHALNKNLDAIRMQLNWITL